MIIANVFAKLQTRKDLVKPLSINDRFRISLDSQNVKGSQKLAKSS